MSRRTCSISPASPKPLSSTSAPASANCRAMPRPIPDVDPVTIATLPLSVTEASCSVQHVTLSRPLLSAPRMECVAPFCSVERGWAASVGQAVQPCLGICQQGCASTQLSSSVNPALSRRWMTYNQRRDGACAAASQVSLVLVGCGHSAQGRWIVSWLGGPDFQGGLPEEAGTRPQFLFDPQQLVVLRQSVRA